MRPASNLGAGVQLRYFGATLDQGAALLRGIVPSLQGGYHADGEAHWDLVPWLGFGLQRRRLRGDGVPARRA